MQVSVSSSATRYVTSKLRRGEFRTAAAAVNFALKRMEKTQRNLARIRRDMKLDMTSPKHVRRKIATGMRDIRAGRTSAWNVREARENFLRKLERDVRK